MRTIYGLELAKLSILGRLILYMYETVLIGEGNTVFVSYLTGVCIEQVNFRCMLY